MAEDKTVYKFEGDATGLIKASKAASKALGTTAKTADKADKELVGLEKQSKKTARGMRGLGGSLKKMNLSFGSAAKGAGMLAVGVLAAGAAMGKLLQGMADSQNELSDLSSRTGVATKTLAGLRLAAKGSGQDFKAVASALKPLVLRIGQANLGMKTAVDGFKAVGVTSLHTADGGLKSADAILLEITKTLSGMEDPTQRAVAASLALGSAGTKLVQALGGQDLSVFINAAEQFGIDTGPRAAAAADKWQRSTANLSLVMEPFTTWLMEVAIGGIQRFSLGWVYVSTLFSELSKNVLPNIGNAFKLIFLKILRLGSPVVDLLISVADGVAVIARWTGIWDDDAMRGYALVTDRLREAQAATNALIDAQIVEIQTTSTLGNAYATAMRKAKAFFDLQNIKTTRGGGGGLGVGGAPTAPTAPTALTAPSWEDITIGVGEIIFDPTPFERAAEALQEASRAMAGLNEGFQSLDIVSSFWADSMQGVADIFTTIAETDFKSMEDNLKAVGQIAATVSNMVGGIIREMMQNNDELSDAQIKNLKRLFITQKAFALVSIAMDTASAAMKAMQLPAPGNFIIAGATIAMGVAQAAIVAGQKAPFHTGGIIPAAPGKQGVMINALPGESVLSREATAGLGSEGVGSLNAGGGAAPQVIEMVYKHRVFDVFVSDNLAKGGPLRDAVRQGRRVGHR